MLMQRFCLCLSVSDGLHMYDLHRQVMGGLRQFHAPRPPFVSSNDLPACASLARCAQLDADMDVDRVDFPDVDFGFVIRLGPQMCFARLRKWFAFAPTHVPSLPDCERSTSNDQ